uniref:Histidine-containing phosphotransfer protein n=1 Tax=Aegilops tauschii subsp. strangulata TaxID=200361 RepID=A0A453QBS7_AEGTS
MLDDQFRQLEMLQDEGNPDFVANVVMLFCEEGERIIGELAKELYVTMSGDLIICVGWFDLTSYLGIRFMSV